MGFPNGGGGGGGAVTSVFTRAGAVVAASGDYTAEQIGPSGALDVAENLADVANAATALANLGGGPPQPIGTRVHVCPNEDITALVGPVTISTASPPMRLFNSNGAQNDAYQFNNIYLVAGTWTLELLTETGTTEGIATVSHDGGAADGTIDTYAGAGPNPNTLLTLAGIVIAASGLHTLKFLMATKNAGASNYYVVTQWITLRRTA